MLYDAVLFDLDGTLLDTLDDIADAANRALTACGLPGHPVEAYKQFVGDGVKVLIQRIVPADRQDAKTMQRCVEAYRQEYSRNWNAKTRPYAGVAEMLDAVKGRGLKIAVLSNKPDDFTQQCVNALLPQWSFDMVMGAIDGRPNKPDPSGAIEVAHRLGVAPRRFLYVGDTGTDMKTARAAGMMAAGVLWGFRERDELEEGGAQHVIARPRELMGLLE